MKQHITIDQYHELSFGAKIKLIEWIVTWTKATDKITLPHQDMNIGRMIEFLDDREMLHGDEYGHLKFNVRLYDDSGVQHNVRDELCDALWESVKAVLEHD